MFNQHSPKYALAPMAGFTDAAFRRICGSFGADYAVSEMISMGEQAARQHWQELLALKARIRQ